MEASSTSASSSRSNGHPFKRYTVTSSNGAHDNGVHSVQYSKKGDWVRLVLKSKELTSRAAKPSSNEKGSRSFSRVWIYAVVLVVVVCYFTAEAFLQGSIGILLHGSAAVASKALAINPFHDLAGKTLSSEGVLEYKVKFVPSKLKERFIKQRLALDKQRKEHRNPIRRPRLAAVCMDLEATPGLLYLVTVWKALVVLGYEFQVFALRDGPMHATWEQTGALVTILELDSVEDGLGVDWLIFEGVILSSLDAKSVLASFLQEPFKEVLVIWILHEDLQRKETWLSGLALEIDVISSYKRAFERADVVLLSDYVLAMKYNQFDTGNFFVLPGSPIPGFEADKFMSKHSREEVRSLYKIGAHDIAVAVVGSPFSYKSVWREHAIVMQAISPLAKVLQKGGVSMRFMIWSVGSTNNYSRALQILAAQMGLTRGSVHHFRNDVDLNKLLWAADVVIYSSLREEQAFPSALVKAMVFEHPIVAPNITVIRENMQDKIHGCIFEAGNDTDFALAFERALSQFGVIDHGHATVVHSNAHGKRLFVANVISGFADFLEGVIDFPSEVHLPLPISLISNNLDKDWQWPLLKAHKSHPADSNANKTTVFSLKPAITGHKDNESDSPKSATRNDDLSSDDWAELRSMKLLEEMEQSEEEQLKERNELLHGTWEEVYRSVKRAENTKNDLHEREDGELERTGQPICIYEPYIGAGTWPLLGEKSILYRGISLIAKQRRPGSDDIEAPLRVPLLNHSYYRDVLCEFGAYFAIANRIDRIHKNSWIGFQSWQAVGRKVSLSSNAELALNNALKGGNNGDTVYFWASTDVHSNEASLQRDFWSFCDAVNNGNCRSVFLKTFKDMFGLPLKWNRLPPMPVDGDRWSALHSWAMPTPSFLEFIMFSRMFVSSLDALFGERHDKCSLGVSTLEVKHCYCQLLELLINVWVYHSGRRMVFLDPVDGSMHEQHNLLTRHGLMWINFFSIETLKGMDADLAEEADDGTPRNKRWIWPRTGEVFCQQIHDRERKQRYTMKLEKKKRDKERVRRIRSRQRQQPLARG
ncbi:hypothetical protein GOP47_0009865 [Adiantum capillus-veneris]|uniref:Glycosyl transferase family 1 domain-containing protein n=1 Tax=Adiantum capillus-veneris TaxID=13818 RepID=A0A9D4UX77_ADICA|nr:hypothetical protein GOP47_0009274 [Adiantum capillus-veneris]KAI5075789.1 hypothetical protein GOP47_0009865 [Adiantum capillus-veneris]